MHLKTKIAMCGALGLLGLGLYASAHWTGNPMARATPSSSNALDPDTNAGERAVLNRLWFDRLPTSGKEDHTLWLFLAGGLGVQMTGSVYRTTTELFDLERAKNRLELVTLQDGKTTEVTFEIKACDDKPPFDLCLRLNEPLRGNQVLYGFGHEDDAAARLGWFRTMRDRAHAEAETETKAR